jgi:hypothetical protein
MTPTTRARRPNAVANANSHPHLIRERGNVHLPPRLLLESKSLSFHLHLRQWRNMHLRQWRNLHHAPTTPKTPTEESDHELRTSRTGGLHPLKMRRISTTSTSPVTATFNLPWRQQEPQSIQTWLPLTWTTLPWTTKLRRLSITTTTNNLRSANHLTMDSASDYVGKASSFNQMTNHTTSTPFSD